MQSPIKRATSPSKKKEQSTATSGIDSSSKQQQRVEDGIRAKFSEMLAMRKMRTHGEGLTIDELVQLNLAMRQMKLLDNG